MPTLSPRLEPSLIEKLSRRYNVFALPAGFSGCAMWRYRMPLAMVMRQPERRLDIGLADNPEKSAKMAEIDCFAKKADVIAMQSPGHWDAHMLMRLYRSQGKKIIIDHDDYSFDLSPANPRYADLGTKECEMVDSSGNTVFRWRDGENGFDLKSNIEKYNAFVACVKEADMVTTTTRYLAEKFKALNPAVRVLPNSIDLNAWKQIPRPAEMDGQVRIGWFGGDSHYSDLEIFKKVIPGIVKRFPEVKIVIQASHIPEWRPIFANIPQDRLEWHGWTDLSMYPLFLAARHFDIGLCPLEDSEFNRCKSDIKWQEFTAVGAAVVAQRMRPYSDSIEHGTTGYLVNTEDQWHEAIAMLVKDARWRKQMAGRAYEKVSSDLNLSQNWRIWEQAYVDCAEGRA